MATVIPAIIPKNFSHLTEEVSKVKDFVSVIQIDITNGTFVKGKTWPYVGDTGEFEQLIKEEIGLPFWDDIDYEFHLMIEEPEKAVEQWIKAGASSIVLQVEAISNLGATRDLCKASEVLLGLSVKPSTDIGVLSKYDGMFDFIQCMGSDDLGHHGAELDESVFEKISLLGKQYPDVSIAIDIGVTEETASEFVNAGATKLISGSAIFESGHIAETISFFQSL